MKHGTSLLAVLALGALPTLAAAQATTHPTYAREVPAALLRQAKVSEDSSLKIASARVPGGKVQAVELEHENGKLIWSWEFTMAGRPGVYECNVNALDGSIVGVEHEMPRTDTTHMRPGTETKQRP
jgi:uncharacterized membrane protein YkoI